MSVTTGVFPSWTEELDFLTFVLESVFVILHAVSSAGAQTCPTIPLPSSLRVISLHKSYRPFHGLFFFSAPFGKKPSEFIFSLCKNRFSIALADQVCFSLSGCVYILRTCVEEQI